MFQKVRNFAHDSGFVNSRKVDFANLIGVNPNNWIASLSGVQDADYPNAPATGAGNF